MPPEMVRVKNTGKKPFSDRWGSVPYMLNPGDTAMVPWGGAVNWFGDPYLIDKPTLAQYDRQEEIQRLETRLGCYDGDDKTRSQRFVENKPSVEVSTLDGDVITMLIDDMDGSGNPPQNIEKVDERVALASELERMKKVQADLLARLASLEAGEDTFAELPTDKPKKVPVDQ
jgi:hypothetical protein